MKGTFRISEMIRNDSMGRGHYLSSLVVEKIIGGRHNTKDKMMMTTRLRMAEECRNLPFRGFITTRYLGLIVSIYKRFNS